MKKFTQKITAFASVLMLLACFALGGCMRLLHVNVREISFVSGGKTIADLSLALGERAELGRYVSFTPATATNKNYTVESDDESVARIDWQSGTVARVYVTAVGVGTATVTATAEENSATATLTVRVEYASPVSVRITAQDANAVGDTVILASDALAPVSFTADPGTNVDPDLRVEWSVNGDEAEVLPCDESFVFTPEGVGRTAIAAAVTGENGEKYADTMYVNVYDDVTGVQLRHESGDRIQTAGNTHSVHWTLAYDALEDGNPEPIVQWFVGDEEKGRGASFAFTPSSPGIFAVSVLLNGKAAGEDTVTVGGVLLPQNVWVDYDNCYPRVLVRWDALSAAAGYEVSIINRTTGREVSGDLSSRNAYVKDKFTAGSFDATEYMTGAYDIFTAEFAVRVRTLGSTDGLLQQSDWSETCVTEKVSVRAKDYLSDFYWEGARNRYVKSYDEFFEWFQYAMVWRPETLEGGEALYLDYEFTSALDEISRAMEEQHFTGSYTYYGSAASGYRKECTFRISFHTDGAPSERTTKHSREAWNSMRPHINYDLGKARSSQYVFPIDRLTPVSVQTSDQLYIAAQMGFNPQPVRGSVAEKLYSYARRTLRVIVTDDMTDAEKLHAIYDWILWRVIYDDAVLDIVGTEESVLYESYYLESVFTDTAYYGVCDAMSKAFVLLARMEGFACVRVTGEAGEEGDRGGHAWNKVRLYDKWYVVDCTWGDSGIQLQNRGDYRESAGHEYFLLADSDIADTHVEDENGRFPETATERYPWYEKTYDFNGETVDFYLDGEQTLSSFREETRVLADYMLSVAQNASPHYSVGPDVYVNRSYSEYYAFEIVAARRWGSTADRPLRTTLSSALLAHGLRAGTDYFLHVSEMGEEVHCAVYFRLSSLS